MWRGDGHGSETGTGGCEWVGGVELSCAKERNADSESPKAHPP